MTMSINHRRGPWSQQEDAYLMSLVQTQGPINWVRIAQQLNTRTPKQCRERYHQNLKPTLNHEPITAEEGLLIEALVRDMGKRWAEIARRLNGRSDNAVKNWWNGSQNRRKRQGTRKPVMGLSHYSSYDGRAIQSFESPSAYDARSATLAAVRSLPHPTPHRPTPLRLNPRESSRPVYNTPLSSPASFSPTSDASTHCDSHSCYSTSPIESHASDLTLPPLKMGFRQTTLSLPSPEERQLPSLSTVTSPAYPPPPTYYGAAPTSPPPSAKAEVPPPPYGCGPDRSPPPNYSGSDYHPKRFYDPVICTPFSPVSGLPTAPSSPTSSTSSESSDPKSPSPSTTVSPLSSSSKDEKRGMSLAQILH